MLLLGFATILFTTIQVHCSPIAASEVDLVAGQWSTSIVPRDGDPDLSTLTTLFNFKGCGQNGDKQAVLQAFADAVDIAAAIAPSVDDVDKIDPYQYYNVVWWGKYDPGFSEPWSKIKGKRTALYTYSVMDTDKVG